MVEQKAQGSGPIEIMNAVGDLVSIPVSALFFEDGTLKARGTKYDNNKAAFDALLRYQAEQKILKPLPTTGDAVPAAVVTAKKKGGAGNDIELAIARPRPDPADTTKTIFDATLTQTDRYRAIIPANLEALLGGSATTGGLANAIFLSSTQASATMPKAGVYAATGQASQATISDLTGNGNAFKVKFRYPDAAADMTVEILDVSEAAGTFSMTVIWTKAVNAIAIADLAGAANFGTLIDVAGPPPGGGAPTLPPAAGTIVLTGGADSAAAAAASGTLPSKS